MAAEEGPAGLTAAAPVSPAPSERGVSSGCRGPGWAHSIQARLPEGVREPPVELGKLEAKYPGQVLVLKHPLMPPH